MHEKIKKTHKHKNYPNIWHPPPHLSMALSSMIKILELEKEKENFPSKYFLLFMLSPNVG